MKPSFELKRNQLLLSLGIGLGFLSLSGIGFYFLGKGTALVASSSHPKSSSIETAVTKIDPHEVWRIKLEDTMAATSQKVTLMEKMLGESLTKEPKDNEVEALRQELEMLKEQVTMSQVTTSQPAVDSQETLVNPFGNGEMPTSQGTSETSNSVTRPKIGKLIFNLKEAPSNGLKKTTDTTIPAGSFVKAVLLGGVDASTSIQASSDPRPVLLRLRDPGTLPRKLKSDLKNCHILASSYGDLSSERVYMRLEKLTCTEPITHEISEMTVSGYVAGEDGKAGLRGVVVDKTGPLLRSSFVGGFLGGMAKFFTHSQQQYSYPLGNTNPLTQANPLTAEQMLKGSFGNGANNALEKYADFYIKRAEQLQPVLQVAAGREVDVVFTESAEIGETLFKKKVAKHNDKHRLTQVSQIPVSRTRVSQAQVSRTPVPEIPSAPNHQDQSTLQEREEAP